MKKLSKGLIILLILYPSVLFTQTVIPGGDVSGTWTKENSPYLIEGEITVPNDSLLTIEPGVTVEFQGHYKFIVKGILSAIGEPDDTITFTINTNATYGWHGLRIISNYKEKGSQFEYCKFIHGMATGSYDDKKGGAIFTSSVVTIRHCLFLNNSAQSGGSAIYGLPEAAFQIENCVFTNNEGLSVIGLSYSDIHITNSIIQNNNASAVSGDRCCIYFINNVISNNTGGGFKLTVVHHLFLTNNTICNNQSSTNGGAINIYAGNDMVFNNNIIFGNISPEGHQIYFTSSIFNTSFYYNNIEGGKENIFGNQNISEYENNIDADPFFYLATPLDYSLQETSPCINSGTPNITGLNLPSLDIIGNPRIYNNSVVDIGAYEFQGSPVPLPEIGIDISMIDFGLVQIDETSTEHSISVINYGNAPLEVTITAPDNFKIRPDGDINFANEISSLFIDPKKDTTIYVVFYPTDTLTYNDSLIIVSNDQNTPLKSVSLSGIGIDAVLLKGTISTDSIICKKNILVNDNVMIAQNARLTICAGTKVEFLDDYSFYVNGNLEAIGEPEDSIYFRLSEYSNPESSGWGGIKFISSDSSTVSYCVIKNAHNPDGAIFCNLGGNPVISHNTISNNYAGISIKYSNPDIYENTIKDNEEFGISIYESQIQLFSNIISNNHSGISLTESEATLINNLLNGNYKGLSVGQSSTDDSKVSAFNNTFVQNTKAISDYSSSSVFRNNILWDNTFQVYIMADISFTDFTYCDIEFGFDALILYNNAVYQGTFENNTDSDPLFLYTPDRPYMLTINSPCIDSGDPDTTGMILPFTDLAGNPRLFNNRIDIGAYEFGVYPPKFITEPELLAMVNEEYTYEIQAVDPTGLSLTFDYISLPDWLTFSTSDTNFALLTGTPGPENLGNNPVEITVKNFSYETSQSFNLKVTQVGVDEYSENLFRISPNPSNGVFYIKCTGDITLPYEVKLMSYTGNCLRTFSVDSRNFQINTADIPKGIYLIEIFSKLRVITQKIIIL